MLSRPWSLRKRERERERERERKDGVFLKVDLSIIIRKN